MAFANLRVRILKWFCLALALSTIAAINSYAHADEFLTNSHRETIRDFVHDLRSENALAIGRRISIPFRRRYPLPPIGSLSDFVKNFESVFPAELREQVVLDTELRLWSHVGWRGLSFDAGWIWLQTDGTLSAVNYMSVEELRIWTQHVEHIRSTVHPSLSDFDSILAIFQTPTYRIWVDNRGDMYRYASWGRSTSAQTNPDIILEAAETFVWGTSGSWQLTLQNGSYTYNISRDVFDPIKPLVVEVLHDGEPLLLEHGTLLYGLNELE